MKVLSVAKSFPRTLSDTGPTFAWSHEIAILEKLKNVENIPKLEGFSVSNPGLCVCVNTCVYFYFYLFFFVCVLS